MRLYPWFLSSLPMVVSSLTSPRVQLDLRLNRLGPEGAAVLAPAIAVCACLTRVDVRNNNIAGDSASQLSAAVLGNTTIEVFNEIPIKEMRADSFTSLYLKDKGIDIVGGMVVAGLLPAMAPLTSLSLANNALGDDGAEALSMGLKENKNLKTLDLSNQYLNRIGPRGATALASAIAVIPSMTRLDVRWNHLGEEGEAALQKAVEGRSGIELEL
jgi:hypothetical protein